MSIEMIAQQTDTGTRPFEERDREDLPAAVLANPVPGREEEPVKRPEIEPEKLPHEDPGIQPDTKPKKEDDDDDDDDDDYEPFEEPEIGDDPGTEKVKIPIM